MSLGKLLATGRSLVGGAPGLGRYDISERNRLPKFGSAKNPFAPSATSEPKAAAPVEVKSEPAPAATDCEIVEQRVAELVRVTEAVCQPQAAVEPETPAVRPFAKTQRIPELADRPVTVVRPVAAARPAGPTGKVELVVGWVMWICVVVARFAAVAGRKIWEFARGIQWGSLRQNGRSLAVVAWKKTKAISTKLAGLIRKRDTKQVFPRLGKPVVQAELSLDTVRVVCNSLEDSDLEIVTAETTTCSQVAPTKPVAEPKRGPMPTALKKITGPLVSVKEPAKALD